MNILKIKNILIHYLLYKVDNLQNLTLRCVSERIMWP